MSFVSSVFGMNNVDFGSATFNTSDPTVPDPPWFTTTVSGQLRIGESHTHVLWPCITSDPNHGLTARAVQLLRQWASSSSFSSSHSARCRAR
jgi:hypothetical protein